MPPTGEEHGSARVTEADVRQIRALYAEKLRHLEIAAGLTVEKIAEKYEIHPNTARRIITRRSWQHVD